MRLQTGKFLVENINELDKALLDENNRKRIIDLDYMGQFEYEGNAIPISRMFIKYNLEEYSFYSTDIFNQSNEQMYIFASKSMIDTGYKKYKDYIKELAKRNIDKNYSLWQYINKSKEECLSNFWWNINSDYFIIFGEEKKELILNFINECYNHDGGKDEIKRKLLKVGYKL